MAELGTVVALIKSMSGADPAVIEQAVQDWLDNHPEATTTVQDGSITEAKLAQDVKGILDGLEDDTASLLEAIASLPQAVEYKFDDGKILLGFGYSATVDAVIVMNNGRANGLFDFAGLKTKPKGTSLEDLTSSDLTTVWGATSTDMHSPFQIKAAANGDGYHPGTSETGFVGGNHTLDNLGTGFETASSVYVNFYADGTPVSSGYGKCSSFEIRWANDIQGYNTVKQGGGGRTVMREYHDMVFDGVTFREHITLKALEEIKTSLWYGLQCVSIGSTYTNISFVDAENRGTFLSSDSGIKSGNAVTSGFIAWGDDHRIEMSVDTGVDLGKRTYYSGDGGAFVSSTKGYFRIIGQEVTMAAGAQYHMDGSYRFMPNIAEASGEIPCTGITLNKNTCSFAKVGDTDTLTATLTPENTTDTLTWTSSDENVATVVDGVVTIHGIGTATITATCGNQTATASVSQTTIKAEYAYTTAEGKTAGSDGASSPVLVETSNETQSIGGCAYRSQDSDLHLRYATDIQCIRVPYGSTKMKYTTSGSAINYIEIVDTEDIVTKGGEDFPKWLSNSTYPSATNGFAVEYGQAFVFRGSSTRISAVSDVFFE